MIVDKNLYYVKTKLMLLLTTQESSGQKKKKETSGQMIKNSSVLHSRVDMNFIKNDEETNPLHLETILKGAKHKHRYLPDAC